MYKEISRKEAYEKIANMYIVSMTLEEIINYCLRWIGVTKSDFNYTSLFQKFKNMDTNCEGEHWLLDLFSSSIRY